MNRDDDDDVTLAITSKGGLDLFALRPPVETDGRITSAKVYGPNGIESINAIWEEWSTADSVADDLLAQARALFSLISN